MIPYKEIPAEAVVVTNTGEKIPPSLRSYDNNANILRLGFEVPESATSFTLQWPGAAAIPLSLSH